MCSEMCRRDTLLTQYTVAYTAILLFFLCFFRLFLFFFQAEDGIRDRSPSRGLGDVYKRQSMTYVQKDCLMQEKWM